jgi:chorismate mutase / prephenate dehydratase
MAKNSNNLHHLREQIDMVDSQILRLLNRRAEIACEVVAIKQSLGMPVYDEQREGAILDRVCGQNQGPLDSPGLTSIFRSIICESRRLEERAMDRVQDSFFQQENCNGDQHGSKRIRS